MTLPLEPAAASFPDCWTAYGATNDELKRYGASPRLAAGHVRLVLLGDLALLAALVIGLASSVGYPPALLVGSILAALVLLSTLAAALWLSATAAQVQPRVRGLVIRSALGATTELPWERIAEISLVAQRGRPAVGLRRRTAGDRGVGGRIATLRRRLTSGCDWLLAPADGDAELLGRVLLRYCIDPRLRRRLLPDA